MTVSLTEFLTRAAADGPVLGVTDRALDTTRVPADLAVRVVDGTTLTSRPLLYRAFVSAWELPAHFGRNADAFDEAMRSLDDVDDHAGAGHLTVVTAADRLLPAESDAADRQWLADSFTFYAGHYRDVGRSPAGFAVLLATTPALRPRVMTRWAEVADVVEVAG
ncbi:MAG: barstar family protein [Gordonia sp. (in: high G+C Gram-positive bacteria)]